jgi:hypothetical protein
VTLDKRLVQQQESKCNSISHPKRTVPYEPQPDFIAILKGIVDEGWRLLRPEKACWLLENVERCRIFIVVTMSHSEGGKR